LNWKPDGFVPASGFLRDFFVGSSGILRELPKDSERIPEGFPKKTLKRQETGTKNSKIPGRVFLKIYFTEALYTLCIFTFLQPHFCGVNRVSDIGDDWLRKKIISIIHLEFGQTAVDDEFYFLKIKNPNLV
jgi:hypothetical protein